MRVTVLLIVLALAGCQKAVADNVDTESYRQAELTEYHHLVDSGMPPADARAQILAARELNRKLEHDPQEAWEEAQRQKDLAELHNSACKSAPWMDSCR